ncbi:MAG: putative lipoprotein, partial [Myxococcota bacterium]
NLVNSYGLDALEYLLWAGPGNDCPSQVDINADGTWDALGADNIEQNRAAFARTISTELSRQAAALKDAWSPDGGDFSGQLTLETAGGPYSSEQEALDALFSALFYVEIATKDRKLAVPLGLQDCSTETCPEDVEHRYSGLGAAAVEANLLGFRDLFTGGAGFGLDDLLVDLGHGDLSIQILADLDVALAAAAVIEAPLDEAIASQPDAVLALHDAIKMVADALKGDLATVLMLEIPAEAAGDND